MAEYPDALMSRVMMNSRQLKDFSIRLHLSLRAQVAKQSLVYVGGCFVGSHLQLHASANPPHNDISSQAQTQVPQRSPALQVIVSSQGIP